jgi:hypothetical protein
LSAAAGKICILETIPGDAAFTKFHDRRFTTSRDRRVAQTMRACVLHARIVG